MDDIAKQPAESYATERGVETPADSRSSTGSVSFRYAFQGRASTINLGGEVTWDNEKHKWRATIIAQSEPLIRFDAWHDDSAFAGILDGLRAGRDEWYALMKRKDPTFSRYPDYDALLDYIAEHGFPRAAIDKSRQ